MLLKPRLWRVQVWGSWLTILCILIAVAPMMAQDLEYRVKQLEDVRAGTHIATIEVRLDNIEFLGKTILGAIIAQLVLGGLSLRGRGSSRNPPLPKIHID